MLLRLGDRALKVALLLGQGPKLGFPGLLGLLLQAPLAPLGLPARPRQRSPLPLGRRLGDGLDHRQGRVELGSEILRTGLAIDLLQRPKIVPIALGRAQPEPRQVAKNNEIDEIAEVLFELAARLRVAAKPGLNQGHDRPQGEPRGALDLGFIKAEKRGDRVEAKLRPVTLEAQRRLQRRAHLLGEALPSGEARELERLAGASKLLDGLGQHGIQARPLTLSAQVLEDLEPRGKALARGDGLLERGIARGLAPE